MKNTFKALKFTSLFLLLTVAFMACDKDFTSLESDMINANNKNFATIKNSFPVIAYNKKLNPVQTNNLSSNLLGVYNDPIYGKTVANIITQVVPRTYNPDFGTNAAIDSVVLTIPYYSKIVSTATDVDTEYSIQDSLYGEAPIKLSIYENTYFLRDFDPDSQDNAAQIYYSNSNETINFDSHLGEKLYEDVGFLPTDDAIVLTTAEDTVSIAPALRVQLDDLFWTETILLKGGSAELSNANNFKNYFRGIYFKAEAIDDNGNMIMLNLNQNEANISIYYSNDSGTNVGERNQNTYVLGFTENRLNTFTNNYTVVLADGDSDLGDEKLYLKGGEGSMAIIDLFGGEDLDGNNLSDNLDDFKMNRDRWLINEAHLVFYEDESISSDAHEYDRLYIYDIKNNDVLFDYAIDGSESSTDPVNSRIYQLGKRTVDDNGFTKYKIRITEHVNNLLQDSTNTKLGLVLSTNVNLSRNVEVLNSGNTEVSTYPSAAILSPKGTILHGSNNNVAEDRRLRLEIYYTEPDNN